MTAETIAAPDLPAAADAIDLADRVVGKAVRQLAASGGPDVHQVLAYDLAHASAQVETARALLDYGGKGEVKAKITCAFTADMGCDSLDEIEIVMALEDEFSIEIPDEDAEKITTVQNAIDYAVGHQKA